MCACVCVRALSNRSFVFCLSFLPLHQYHHRCPTIGRCFLCAGGRSPPVGLGATELCIIDLRVEANKNRRTVKTRTPVPRHCISVPGDTRSPSVRRVQF